MNPLISPMTYYLDPNIISNKIIKKSIRGYYSDYYILNYDKLGICFDDEKTGIYRSVVFSNPENCLLSFSPTMSISSFAFIEKYPTINYDILINEFVEGVMINLFYDYRVKKWVIATKSAIGGKYGYGTNNKTINKRDTFYEMFLDALHINKSESLNNIEMLEYFPKLLSYTFILQHPKNVISIPVSKPRIVLVSVYLINSEKNQAEFIPSIFYENWPEFKNISGIIDFPKQYEFHDYGEVIKQNMAADFAGYMITNVRTGERCRIKSNKYNIMKKMTRMDSSIQYHYFCIRRIGKLKEYVKEFPNYKKAFYLIEEEYENMIKMIHDLYCDIYIYKTKDADDIDIKHLTHVYKIHHNIYLQSVHCLLGPLRKVYKKTVRKYFDEMDPRELLYIMSEDKR